MNRDWLKSVMHDAAALGVRAPAAGTA